MNRWKFRWCCREERCGDVKGGEETRRALWKDSRTFRLLMAAGGAWGWQGPGSETDGILCRRLLSSRPQKGRDQQGCSLWPETAAPPQTPQNSFCGSTACELPNPHPDRVPGRTPTSLAHQQAGYPTVRKRQRS